MPGEPVEGGTVLWRHAIAQDNQEWSEYPKLEDANEANVLWDEYKYRHDLIWRHLIRSTLALVTLVTVGYSTVFKSTCWLVVFAWVVALGYWFVALFAIEAELRLYIKIKRLHRERQNHYFELDLQVPQGKDKINWGAIFLVDPFSKRVGVYLFLLFIATVLAGMVALLDPELTLCEQLSVALI
jgi:hypothetical protein